MDAETQLSLHACFTACSPSPPKAACQAACGAHAAPACRTTPRRPAPQCRSQLDITNLDFSTKTIGLEHAATAPEPQATLVTAPHLVPTWNARGNVNVIQKSSNFVRIRFCHDRMRVRIRTQGSGGSNLSVEPEIKFERVKFFNSHLSMGNGNGGDDCPI